MAADRVRKSLSEDALAASVRAAKEAPHPEFDSDWDAFPWQIRVPGCLPTEAACPIHHGSGAG